MSCSVFIYALRSLYTCSSLKSIPLQIDQLLTEWIVSIICEHSSSNMSYSVWRVALTASAVTTCSWRCPIRFRISRCARIDCVATGWRNSRASGWRSSQLIRLQRTASLICCKSPIGMWRRNRMTSMGLKMSDTQLKRAAANSSPPATALLCGRGCAVGDGLSIFDCNARDILQFCTTTLVC